MLTKRLFLCQYKYSSFLFRTMGAKGFESMLPKCFSYPQLRMCFAIVSKVQNLNLQCRCGHQDNSECEIISEELSDYPF